MRRTILALYTAAFLLSCAPKPILTQSKTLKNETGALVIPVDTNQVAFKEAAICEVVTFMLTDSAYRYVILDIESQPPSSMIRDCLQAKNFTVDYGVQYDTWSVKNPYTKGPGARVGIRNVTTLSNTILLNASFLTTPRSGNYSAYQAVKTTSGWDIKRLKVLAYY